jgi:fumarylacetoacetase
MASDAEARVDATTEPGLRSWVPVPDGSDFPIQNLPYGAFVRAGERPRLGVAIGDAILALDVVANAGLLDDACAGARDVFAAPTLNALLAAGRPAWRRVRERVSALLRAEDRTLRDAGLAPSALVPRGAVRNALPVAIGDFVDFYSSLAHATNAGKIFRPGGAALPPNWRAMPIGYHGRAGTVIVSGTPVARPRGQRLTGGLPEYGPTRALDFELELGFVTGAGPEPPFGIVAGRARESVFGVALLCDWSARDVQAWESVPLGPFLGKSFATSLSPWIVTLDALEPFRVAGPVQEPPAPAHLATSEPEGYDIGLSASLASQAMRERGLAEQVITRTNFQTMYWSMAQQLAHATSNGARVRAGDLFGSGTISDDAPGTYGSLLELTWNGSRPLALADGSERAFLEDGDELVMRGRCAGAGRTSFGFGELRASVVPAVS